MFGRLNKLTSISGVQMNYDFQKQKKHSLGGFTRDFLFKSDADRSSSLEENEKRLRALGTDAKSYNFFAGGLTSKAKARTNQLSNFIKDQKLAATESSATRQVLLERSKQKEDEKQNLRALALGV